jgi:hypothetical protein
MSEDGALYGGSIAIGGALVAAQLAAGGAYGTGATLGMCLVVFGIRGLRTRYRFPRARVIRRR